MERNKCLLLPAIRNVQPFTEMDLRGIYENIQLVNREAIVKKFINDDQNTSQHEFCELLQDYYRSRVSELSSHQEVLKLNEAIFQQVDTAWHFESNSVEEEGTCEDDCIVEVKHHFETASYREDISSSIAKSMKQLRECIFETHSLHCYSSEMNRIRVENYIQKVVSACPEVQELGLNSPVSCKATLHPPHLEPHVTKLRSCISVLFAFQRRSLQDNVFVEESRRWLTDLVALLLRLANNYDHLFLLNHVLRCPKGVASWALNFIQVCPPGAELEKGGAIGGAALDHCLTVLAIMLSPITARAQFLHSTRPSFLPAKQATGNVSLNKNSTSVGGEEEDDVWVLMDSSGDEEEDLAVTWCNLGENDVIELLNQVPFESLFRHLLQLPMDCSVRDHYRVADASPNTFLRLFAVCTAIIGILKTGLDTYSSGRFKDLRRRLCRIIRHVVHHVSDHWSNYLHHHLYNPAVLQQHSGAAQHHCFPSADPIWSRLQVEYDELFGRAVESIVCTPKSWQFLAVIPYTAVSQQRLWCIIYALHTGTQTDASRVPEEGWAAVLRHSDTRGRFRDRLLKVAPSEGYYLLTTFANMATARPGWESEFIEVVVRNQFELSVVCEQTTELCSKSGRDLLAAVANKHPNITISTLLAATQESLGSCGVVCLLLYRHLPLQLWRPTPDQLHLLLYWLEYCDAGSTENALARLILSRLNWGHESHTQELALPAAIHLQVACGLVSACVGAEKRLAIGGGAALLPDTVKTVTAAVLATSPQQTLMDWCWQQMGVLRLHKLDQLSECGELQGAAMLSGVPDVTHSSLLSVRSALLENRHIALYFSLLVTTWGHSIPQVCDEGVKALEVLVEGGHYNALVVALHCITPLLWHTPHTFTTDARLMTVLRQVLDADQSYYQRACNLLMVGQPGPVLQLLHAMIHTQLLQHKRYGLKCPRVAAVFWVQALTSVPGWSEHQSVLYVLDGVCRLLHQYPAAHGAVAQVLKEHAKTVILTAPDCGSSTRVGSSVLRPLSSLLSWLGSNISNASLLASPDPQLPWYTMLVLKLDTEWEDHTRIWKNLLKHLYDNSDSSLDAALKMACRSSDVSFPNHNSLSLYRWAQQLLGLSVADPAFLLTLQFFMTRHLARVPPHPQELGCGSVIPRFYEGLVNGNFLQKIKRKVADAVLHYQRLEEEERKRVRQDETDELVLQMEEKQYSSLPFLRECSYQHMLVVAMKAWLNEEKLYLPGVFVTTLPPALNPTKLELVIQEDWQAWEELYSPVATNSWSKQLLRKWLKHRNRSYEASGGSSTPSDSRSSSPQASLENIADGTASAANTPAASTAAANQTASSLKHHPSPSAPLLCTQENFNSAGRAESYPLLPQYTDQHIEPSAPPQHYSQHLAIAPHMTMTSRVATSPQHHDSQYAPSAPHMTSASHLSTPPHQHMPSSPPPPPHHFSRDSQASTVGNSTSISATSLPGYIGFSKECCKGSGELLEDDAQQRMLLPPESIGHIASISKRLKEYDVPLLPPTLPCYSSRSPPNSPSTGMTRGTGTRKALDQAVLLSDISNYYKLVMSHAEVMVSRWREMCSGDCLILDLLPQLYSNVERRVVRRQECQPRPPPRGKPPRSCSGSATVVLQFCEGQRSDGISVRLEQLVSQRKLLLQQSLDTPPLQVCTAAATIHTLLTLLVGEHRAASQGSSVATGEESRTEELWKSGWRLFWQVLSEATQENYYYPPAKQLTAATAALLGQEFVSGMARCQEQLLTQLLLEDEAKGTLIAPHFSPLVVSSQRKVKLYQQLTAHACSNQNVVFMLLSKFELSRWRLSESESVELLQIISGGMQQLLGQRDREVSLIFGIYRVHWCSLLRRSFTQLYVPALELLLLRLSTGCCCDAALLCNLLWFDMLNLMATPRQQHDDQSSSSSTVFAPHHLVPDMINDTRILLHTQIWLTPALVEESMRNVSRVFERQRFEQALYGLYPLYKHCVLPIAVWCSLSSHALVYYTQQYRNKFECVWGQLEGLWSHWVYPYLTQSNRAVECPQWVRDMVGEKRFLQPWTSTDTSLANILLAFYAASFAYFHQAWRGRECVLSRILHRYCTTMADKEVKEHVLMQVHTHLLSALPWHHLTPTLQHLQLVTKIINKYLPECHSFLGQIMIQVPWARIVPDAVQAAAEPPSHDTSAAGHLHPVKLHSLLLNIIVRIAMEPSIRQCGPLHSLITAAESFHWELLDVQSYEPILNWFVQSCDPRVVLPLPGRSSVDSSVMHLLHVAANYTPECGQFNPDTGKKRTLLCKTLVRLLTSSAARHKHLLDAQPQHFTLGYTHLLDHLQATVHATVAAGDAETAARALCTELVAAVGHGAASPPLQEVCRDALVEWARRGSHPSSVVVCALLFATARGVLQLQHRNMLLDALIHATFTTHGVGMTWSRVVQLLWFPANSPAPMVIQAAQDGHLLVVYGYLQWRYHGGAGGLPIHDFPSILRTLIDALQNTTPSSESEVGFLLLLAELLDMICHLVVRSELVTAAWQSSYRLVQLLLPWEEDRRSTGLLGAIGFGPRTNVSTSVRVICRSVRAFLVAQLSAPGVFCALNDTALHNDNHLQSGSEEEGQVSSAASLAALSSLLSMRSNATYKDVLPAIETALLFIQDSSKIITDATKLYTILVDMFYADNHIINRVTALDGAGRILWNLTVKRTDASQVKNSITGSKKQLVQINARGSVLTVSSVDNKEELVTSCKMGEICLHDTISSERGSVDKDPGIQHSDE
uniref:Ectopic P granules protein 5 homolog isoform X3 n=1 Tax=Hirondellea gigas TaxID=1518452 RepID=A0A6A7FV46_9CRUS